jgi:2-methylcitrate dehydratase PrpD
LKAYCACYCTHAYIDAVRPLAGQVDEITGVQVGITPAFNLIVGTTNRHAYAPKSIEHVQYSLPTQMAFALLGLGNGYRVHRDYMAGKIDMDPVMATARRIEITETPELEQRYPGKFVADVNVTFRDRTSKHVFVEDPIGTVANPMSEAEQDRKFMELTTDVLGEERARVLLATLKMMDTRAKAADIMAMCTARGTDQVNSR